MPWGTAILLVTPSGDLYVEGFSDGVLTNTEPLFQIQGRFKVGQAGTDLMNQGNSWVNWDVTGESLVTCRASGALTKPLPVGLHPINEFLGVLEVNGYVRVKIKTHGTAERNMAKPGTFIVKAESVAVLDPAVAEKGVATVNNISSFVSTAGLKTSPHVLIAHRLEFNLKAKELTSDYPGVFLKSPLQVKKGDFVQLAVAPAAAAGGQGAEGVAPIKQD